MAAFTLDRATFDQPDGSGDFDHSTYIINRMSLGLDMASVTNASALGTGNATIGDVWWFDGTTWHLALG